MKHHIIKSRILRRYLVVQTIVCTIYFTLWIPNCYIQDLMTGIGG